MISVIYYTQMQSKLITSTMTHVLLFQTLDIYHPSTWQCFLHVKSTAKSNVNKKIATPNLVFVQSSCLTTKYHQLSIVQKSKCDLSTCFFFFFATPSHGILSSSPKDFYLLHFSQISLLFDIFNPPLSWSNYHHASPRFHQ